MTMEKDVTTGVWKLSGGLSIENAKPLREALMQCFADAGGVILDVAAVSECDTTGLQLLLAAQRTAALQGRAFRIERPLEGPVTTLAQTLGIALDMVAQEEGPR